MEILRTVWLKIWRKLLCFSANIRFCLKVLSNTGYTGMLCNPPLFWIKDCRKLHFLCFWTFCLLVRFSWWDSLDKIWRAGRLKSSWYWSLSISSICSYVSASSIPQLLLKGTSTCLLGPRIHNHSHMSCKMA